MPTIYAASLSITRGSCDELDLAGPFSDSNPASKDPAHDIAVAFHCPYHDPHYASLEWMYGDDTHGVPGLHLVVMKPDYATEGVSLCEHLVYVDIAKPNESI